MYRVYVVRYMYVCSMYVVFPWDLDTMILNRCGVKGHQRVNYLWFKFLKNESLYPHTLILFSRDLDTVILG